MRSYIVLLALFALGSLGCGEGLNEPPPVNLRVRIIHAGVDPDADGYVVSAGGKSVAILQPSGTADFFLPVGLHEVAVERLAANCSLSASASTRVVIVPGQFVELPLRIECRAVTGAIFVAVSQSGRDFDSDFTVSVDGADAGIAPGVIEGRQPGSYVVALGDINANCAVSGSGSQVVTVTAGGMSRDTVNAIFKLACAAVTGDVELSVATTGGRPDPNGYTLLLDGELVMEPCFYCYWGYYGGAIVRLVGTTSRLFEQIQPGVRTYELSDVSPFCVVEGSNPRPVTVSIGATARVSFDVACPAP
jgi:hypothetical protein